MRFAVFVEVCFHAFNRRGIFVRVGFDCVQRSFADCRQLVVGFEAFFFCLQVGGGGGVVFEVILYRDLGFLRVRHASYGVFAFK